MSSLTFRKAERRRVGGRFPARFLGLVAVAAIAGPAGLVRAEEAEDQDITVRAKSLRIHDEVTYAPHSVAIAQPASDIYLGETLSKIPGMLVRSTSGFGSVTTVISAEALGSAGTAVSIDDIPVIDSSGRGVNFSLFPSTLIAEIEHHSSFYPSMDPTADTLPAAGGRIDLRTLKAPRPGEPHLIGSLSLGTANTIEATAGMRGGDATHEWVGGVTGYNTQGNYHYVDPSNGRSANRDNNDATGVGALGKYRFNLSNDSSVELLEFASNGDRTNPGSLFSPARQHQKDTFNLLGVRYQGPRLLSEHDGVFGKAAWGYSRTATRGPDGSFGPAGQSTDQRGNGAYAQGGYMHDDDRVTFSAALDNQYDHVSQDEGVFLREVFGATTSLAVKLGRVRVVPLVRVDVATQFPASIDGETSVVYSPDADYDLALSFGATHTYPAITSVGGFTAGGLTVLSNPDLHVQRDNTVALTFDTKKQLYTLYSSVFYDLVRNRSTFSFVGPTSAQFVNLSEVSVMGWTLDGQLFPVESLSLRASSTLQRAWDRSTGNEMPYKPRLTGWGAVSYLITSRVGLTVQEQFSTKRLVSAGQLAAVDPFAQTIIRLDAQVGPGVAYFKAANIFDAGGFDYPGFPYAGRSFWLGYTIGAAAL